MANHKISAHSEEKPYKCHVCPEMFSKEGVFEGSFVTSQTSAAVKKWMWCDDQLKSYMFKSQDRDCELL